MHQLKWTIVEDGYFVPHGLVSKHDLVYDANRKLVLESTFWRKHPEGWVNRVASGAPSVLPKHLVEGSTTDTLLFLAPRQNLWVQLVLRRSVHFVGEKERA